MDYTCTLCIWIVTAIVTGITIVLTVLYCTLNSTRIPNVREKDPVVNKYSIIPVPEGPKEKPDIDPKHNYTDDEAIELTNKMKGVTLLRTNKGKIHFSTHRKHAEIVFIKKTQNPVDITELWITNSPCSDCATCLITHFESRTKPKIFIGKIYERQTEEVKKKDDKGLQYLMKEGFNIQVWESFQKNPQILEKTKTHLQSLKEKAYIT